MCHIYYLDPKTPQVPGRVVYQCVAVCCSVLQCVAVCRSVLQCAAVCCSLLQRDAVCGSILQCAAVRIVGCYNGRGGGNFSKVKRSVASAKEHRNGYNLVFCVYRWASRNIVTFSQGILYP